MTEKENDIQKDPVTILITPFRNEDVLFYYLNEEKTITQDELIYIMEMAEAGCAYGSTYHLFPDNEEVHGGIYGYAGSLDQLN